MIIAYGPQNDKVTVYDCEAMEYFLAFASMYIPKFVKEMIPEYKDLDIKGFDRGVKVQINLFDDLYKSRKNSIKAQFNNDFREEGKTLAGCTMSADPYLHRICVSLGGQGVIKKGGPVIYGPMFVSNILETYVHEMIHVLQTYSGRAIQHPDESCTFDGVKYTYAELQYRDAPWEVEAFRYMKPITDKLYQTFNDIIIANDGTEEPFIRHIEHLTKTEDGYVQQVRAKKRKKAVDNAA